MGSDTKADIQYPRLCLWLGWNWFTPPLYCLSVLNSLSLGLGGGRRMWMRGVGGTWEAVGLTDIIASATWLGASLANYPRGWR